MAKLELTLVDAKDAGAEEWEHGTGVSAYYEQLYHSFGPVLLDEGYGSYSGDTLVLYGHNWEGPVAYLNFGWGSCSYCDALEACDTIAEVNELMGQLYRSVRYFDDVDAFLAWATGEGGTGSFEWYEDDGLKDFVEKVKERRQ